MAEQLGLVTMKPPDCLRHFWHSSSLVCCGLTSGITRGTSGCMRNALALEITAWPADANLGSTSVATAASSAEKTTLGAPSGSQGETCKLSISVGIAVFNRQRAAAT